jgi:hypothetical protein
MSLLSGRKIPFVTPAESKSEGYISYAGEGFDSWRDAILKSSISCLHGQAPVVASRRRDLPEVRDW